MVSAVTRTQYQAPQLSFFVFLPSVLLSGFRFPFAALALFCLVGVAVAARLFTKRLD